MTISQTIEKLERVSGSLDAIFIRAINATEQEFQDLNESQWAEGTFNKKLPGTTTQYSKPYAALRRKAGLQTDYVDFKFSGALYKGYKIDISRTQLKLSSDVPYEKFVTGRFGVDMWGLTDENLGKYRKILAPIVQAEAKLQFNG